MAYYTKLTQYTKVIFINYMKEMFNTWENLIVNSLMCLYGSVPECVYHSSMSKFCYVGSHQFNALVCYELQ